MTNHDIDRRAALAMMEYVLSSMRPIGRALADLSDLGAIVGTGEQPEGQRKRWLLVIATNDAADALEEWQLEQHAIRDQASREAGHTITSINATRSEP